METGQPIRRQNWSCTILFTGECVIVEVSAILILYYYDIKALLLLIDISIITDYVV